MHHWYAFSGSGGDQEKQVSIEVPRAYETRGAHLLFLISSYVMQLCNAPMWQVDQAHVGVGEWPWLGMDKTTGYALWC